jgi:hypothetical protein
MAEALTLALPVHPPTDGGEFDRLCHYLLEQARRCVRAPVERFEHPWLSPMPPPLTPPQVPPLVAAAPSEPEDRFKQGDYSQGLFHHDASESAIELVRHPDLLDAAAGSLLCFLDCAEPSGLIHRVELPHKSREAEPAKPVMAQMAARVMRAKGDVGPAWLEEHRVYDRVARFLEYLEQHYTGLHGLFLTHSALQSGFDSDLLTAALPDRSVEGPDTNAFMVREYRAMADMSRALGRRADGERYDEKASRLCARMEKLLYREDERGGFYCALRWQHGVASPDAEVVGGRDAEGRSRPYESWVSLFPLYAGIPSPERARKVMARLLDERLYWGPSGVRTASREDPFFHQAARVMLYDYKKQGRGPVSNWSGPVWVLSSYYLCKGLTRYGYLAQARELALKTARLLARDLELTGRLHECYDDEGRGLWPRRTGSTFISWNVLALTMLRQLVPEVAQRWTAQKG